MRRSLLFLGLLFAGCDDSPKRAADAPPAQVSATAPSATPRDDGPLRLETYQPAAGAPSFVMRGGPRGAGRLVFLHGMCGHALGYAQAFQYAAARVGTLIAPQGDVSCGGPWSKWSADTADLDRRIVEAFRATGDEGPHDRVWVMGMSQGATRAAALARRWPKRYTHLVAMAAPSAIRLGDLKQLSAAVLMAGDRDRRDLMQQSERALRATGVPSLFLLIPEASHGSMGQTPEETMGAALAFLSLHPAH